MMTKITYKWQLRRLQEELNRLTKRRDQAIQKAKRQKKSGIDIGDLLQEWDCDLVPVEEEIEAWKTKYWCEIAHKLVVPTPDRSDNNCWRANRATGCKNILTTKGVQEVRNNIRSEKKEKREGVLAWVGVLGPLVVGVLGALTGLVAVLQR